MIPHNAICFFPDGSQWCCVFGNFNSIQDSPVGFGDSFDSALENLRAQSRTPTTKDSDK